MSITLLTSSSLHSRTPAAPHRNSFVGAAVFLAFNCASERAHSEDQVDVSSAAISQVVVTANRREQSVQDVPYSLSVVSAEQLQNTGVTDIASMTSQVPGLSMYALGTRDSGATTPIIRGINATAAPSVSTAFRTFEQSPVGVYIGNSPINGYFELTDIQRVEVLRGPQGTLYGAGALGGALRIIPNDPKLARLSGNLEVDGGTVAHSGGASYGASATVNLPVGETFAFRMTGKYSFEPGYIDAYGLLQRPGSAVSGIPTLANPADPVNSSGVFYSRKDWNDQDNFTGRASILWKPVDDFSVLGAYVYSRTAGNAAPVDNPGFLGGSYPLDPRITLPPGAEYRVFSAVEQPFSRKTTLGSLDISYDAGFATASSTSSYYTTDGSDAADSTAGLASLPAYLGYYAGTPTNPRFVNANLFLDNTHAFTQEVRLVSNTAPDRLFDYAVGVYLENQFGAGTWFDSNPGSPERSVAQGCTAPYYFGASFPNCLVVSGPGDVHVYLNDEQHFRDISGFGELTVHFLKYGQIVFGGRHFDQRFTDSQVNNGYTFGPLIPATPRTTTASKNIWKVNPSYEYSTGQYIYAIWSQGFRRGGANAVPVTGPFKENPQLLSYVPDTVDNYEVGIKGRIKGGGNYALDLFFDNWHRPQVGGLTPIGNFAVWNANQARSKGVEFDINGQTPVPGISVVAGFNYTEATFTEDYSYAANEGGGQIVPNKITGTAGQQLPGSSKASAMLTINYDRNIGAGYALNVSLNDTYRSAMVLSTFASVYGPPLGAPGLNLLNLSSSVDHRSWHFGVYVTNLTDKRAVLAPPFAVTNVVNYLTSNYIINEPRKINLRLGYSF